MRPQSCPRVVQECPELPRVTLSDSELREKNPVTDGPTDRQTDTSTDRDLKRPKVWQIDNGNQKKTTYPHKRGTLMLASCCIDPSITPVTLLQSPVGAIVVASWRRCSVRQFFQFHVPVTVRALCTTVTRYFQRQGHAGKDQPSVLGNIDRSCL